MSSTRDMEVPVTDLQTEYRTRIRAELQKALGKKNQMEVPRLVKIVVSLGVKATDSKDVLKALVAELRMITGQAPLVTKSRKSISNFKLREGMLIGAKVTLRGRRMYDFMGRMIHAAFPRIRDFRGLPMTGFDGRGNYNMGVDEQTIFPEVNPDEVKHVHGMNVCIVTTAKTDAEAGELLKRLGFPLAERGGREKEG